MVGRLVSISRAGREKRGYEDKLLSSQTSYKQQSGFPYLLGDLLSKGRKHDYGLNDWKI
jgi:hypothetical protein